MNTANRYYVTIAIVLCFASSALSIRCFQCSSYEDPACAELKKNDTNSEFYKECKPVEGHQVFCRKTVQSLLNVEAWTRITRSCGWIIHKSNESNCRLADSDFKLERSCQCFSDGCNSATLTAISPGLALLVPLLLTIRAVIISNRSC